MRKAGTGGMHQARACCTKAGRHISIVLACTYYLALDGPRRTHNGLILYNYKRIQNAQQQFNTAANHVLVHGHGHALSMLVYDVQGLTTSTVTPEAFMLISKSKLSCIRLGMTAECASLI